MRYKYTVEYYSAMKSIEISPCATTWTDLDVTGLHDISQTEKTNTV